MSSRYKFFPPSGGWPQPSTRVRNVPISDQLPGYDALKRAVSTAMLSVCDSTVGDADKVAEAAWNELANGGWGVRQG